MANALDKDKRRVTYAEWKDVFGVIEEIAEARSRDAGRTISPTEIIREIVLKRANAELVKQGKKRLKRDPTSTREMGKGR